jgi:hypothetical protein
LHYLCNNNSFDYSFTENDYIDFLMKRHTLLLYPLLCLFGGGILCAQPTTDDRPTTPLFEDYFTEKTLRVDYSFAGDATDTEISLAELTTLPAWAGRHQHLDSIPLRGNGSIEMRETGEGRVIYRTSFSTLFQEWQGTEEATHCRRSFENVFLLPMPKDSVTISVTLYDLRGNVSSTFTHGVSPRDILIRPLTPSALPPHRYLLRSQHPEAIDVAIVAEGYTADEAEQFYRHATEATDALFSYEPFKSYTDAFNMVAVALPSQESGVSIPGKGEWKHTALASHFDTFYSDRYLTTLHLRDLHNALAGIPYEHIIILANTDNYGGGGIYNSYTLTAARHEAFRPVVVHEFGHSFAGLADEYYYDDQYTEFYYPDIEPWEQNITTRKDFSLKWEDMLSATPKKKKKGNTADAPSIGLYEGGGYQSKGVWRACEDCRMKTNTAATFCPVCQRAIRRLISFYVGE